MDAATIIWNYFRERKITNYEEVFQIKFNDRAAFALLLIDEPSEEELAYIWENYREDTSTLWYLFYNYDITKLRASTPLKKKMIQYQNMQGQVLPFDSLPVSLSYQTLLDLRRSGFKIHDLTLKQLTYRISFEDLPFVIDILYDLYQKETFWEEAVFVFQDYVLASLIPFELAFLGIISNENIDNFEGMAIKNFYIWLKTNDRFYHSFLTPIINDRYKLTQPKPNVDEIRSRIKNPNIFMTKIVSFVKRKEDNLQYSERRGFTYPFESSFRSNFESFRFNTDEYRSENFESDESEQDDMSDSDESDSENHKSYGFYSDYEEYEERDEFEPNYFSDGPRTNEFESFGFDPRNFYSKESDSDDFYSNDFESDRSRSNRQNKYRKTNSQETRSSENIVFERDALRHLDLTPPVDCSDIRRAYRRKSLSSHPDKGGSNEQFLQTQRSYELLNKINNC